MKFVQDKVLLLLGKIACFSNCEGVLFGISENITDQISGSGVKLMEENLQKNASGFGKYYKSSE